MTEGKSINLLKAAKELNIGIATAVEFLSKKGFDIESKPNTKLNGEMYNVLLKEYQGDKIVKEEANQIVIGKIRRDETPIDPIPTNSNKETETEEILIKNSTFSPPAETKNKEQSSKEKEEPSEEKSNTPEADFSNRKGVKVVGKIDLNNINQRTKPEKAKPKEEKPIENIPEVKASPTPEVKIIPEVKPIPEIKKAKEPIIEDTTLKQAEEKSVAPEKPVETPKPVVVQAELEKQKEVETPEKKVEDKVAEKEKTEAPKTEVKVAEPEVKAESKPEVKQPEEPKKDDRDGIFRTKTTRLTGPNVIGKIELPSPRKKSQPVASSTGSGTDHKRKRKRKEAPAGQQNRPHTNTPGTGIPHTPNTPGQHPNRAGANPGGGANRGPGQHAPRGRADFNKSRARQPAVKKEEPTEKEIQDQIKATLARLSGAGKSGKFAQRAKLRRQKRDDVALSSEEAAMERELQAKVLRVTEFVTANEL